MTNIISVPNLTFAFTADRRYSQLSLAECMRGYRVIGGDCGDVRFDGFHVDAGTTELLDVSLVTTLEGLSEEEAASIAKDVVQAAFASIGKECVEHS